MHDVWHLEHVQELKTSKFLTLFSDKSQYLERVFIMALP